MSAEPRPPRSAADRAARRDLSDGAGLSGWATGAALAGPAERRAVSVERLRDVDPERLARAALAADDPAAADALRELAEQLTQARKMVALADSLGALVGCPVRGGAEVGPLPPDRLGPLAEVYDGVRQGAGLLASRALLLADAADRRAARALGAPAGPPPCAGPEPVLARRYALSRRRVRAARAALRDADPAPLPGTAAARRLQVLDELIGPHRCTGVDPATGRPRRRHQHRLLLEFDPNGAGRVTEVFGDLVTAHRVAVLVPGDGTDLDQWPALAADAHLLADAAGPGTAVLCRLGDDPPLARFLTALLGPHGPVRPDAGLVLVGHGAGSGTVAAALRAGCPADDAVFVGSPGLGPRIRSAADLRPRSPRRSGRPPARLWAMRAPGDGLAYSHARGSDPAEFAGVTRLDTQGGVDVLGPDRYHAVGGEALDNLARVVAGRYDEVTTADTTLAEELALAGLDSPRQAAAPPRPDRTGAELLAALGAALWPPHRRPGDA